MEIKEKMERHTPLELARLALKGAEEARAAALDEGLLNHEAIVELVDKTLPNFERAAIAYALVSIAESLEELRRQS